MKANNCGLLQRTLTNVSALSIRALTVRGACTWTGLSLHVRGVPLADCSCSEITDKRRAYNILAFRIAKFRTVSLVHAARYY